MDLEYTRTVRVGWKGKVDASLHWNFYVGLPCYLWALTECKVRLRFRFVENDIPRGAQTEELPSERFVFRAAYPKNGHK